MATLTTVQHSALGDLHRFGRLWPPGPRQLVERGTPQGFSRRTLDALVAAGHARWERRDGVMPHIVPTDAGSDHDPDCRWQGSNAFCGCA